MLVYKIFRSAEWQAFQAAGSSTGAPIDLTDGYIHLSTAAQVADTLRLHFAGLEGLILLALEAESLGKAVLLTGEERPTGPTPLAALGATDQHSLLQLLMEGPHDKVVLFVDVLPVPPPRTRPCQFTGGIMTVHPQSSGLQYVIESVAGFTFVISPHMAPRFF